ncbi:hypothetical protein HK105_209247 [Polyrhizophydium stewartii]|uniref:Uncharacterized protein n=1 Tax=Polyrhizophydium stewartii TaxID=2732419 RepID=A0ABR4MVI5_9FUNG|nr:hypothetical protein HK105_004436 [Polyrhizophydium stewartii]
MGKKGQSKNKSSQKEPQAPAASHGAHDSHDVAKQADRAAGDEVVKAPVPDEVADHATFIAAQGPGAAESDVAEPTATDHAPAAAEPATTLSCESERASNAALAPAPAASTVSHGAGKGREISSGLAKSLDGCEGADAQLMVQVLAAVAQAEAVERADVAAGAAQAELDEAAALVALASAVQETAARDVPPPEDINHAPQTHVQAWAAEDRESQPAAQPTALPAAQPYAEAVDTDAERTVADADADAEGEALRSPVNPAALDRLDVGSDITEVAQAAATGTTSGGRSAPALAISTDSPVSPDSTTATTAAPSARTSPDLAKKRRASALSPTPKSPRSPTSPLSPKRAALAKPLDAASTSGSSITDFSDYVALLNRTAALAGPLQKKIMSRPLVYPPLAILVLMWSIPLCFLFGPMVLFFAVVYHVAPLRVKRVVRVAASAVERKMLRMLDVRTPQKH